MGGLEIRKTKDDWRRMWIARRPLAVIQDWACPGPDPGIRHRFSVMPGLTRHLAPSTAAKGTPPAIAIHPNGLVESPFSKSPFSEVVLQNITHK